MSDTLGIVIIGRNEGERLVRCLAAVCGRSHRVVYVDSGSTDDSVAAARAAGAEVVELDTSIPFSAARARNEGFTRLMTLEPELSFVQFIDGDCEMSGSWLDRGVRELQSRPELAAVCGKLRERFPNASIYNHLCDLEWNRATGDIEACGGVAMYRVKCFTEVGGFDPTVMAGEEPELCLRLRGRGYQIARLPDEMAWHDSAMYHFGQWWKRQMRGGYGGMDVARRFEAAVGGGGFTRQIQSARRWVFGYPLALALATACGWLVLGAAGALAGAIAGIGVLALQIGRLTLRMLQRGIPAKVALAYGVLTMAAKAAHVWGHRRYRHDLLAGKGVRLIEHKAMESRITTASA